MSQALWAWAGICLWEPRQRLRRGAGRLCAEGLARAQGASCHPPAPGGERGRLAHPGLTPCSARESVCVWRPSRFTEAGSGFRKSPTQNGKIRGTNHLARGQHPWGQEDKAESSMETEAKLHFGFPLARAKREMWPVVGSLLPEAGGRCQLPGLPWVSGSQQRGGSCGCP